MAGRIPQQFIDDLVSRVDIVDVIDERVPLKKKGKEYAACCPFHEEKTPSFTVSSEKQFFHCFGCGAHGTVIGFLMDYGHMDFVEAVHVLAERAGMEVPRGAGDEAEGPDRRALYEVLEQADEFYRRQLREQSQAGRAVSYLRGRQLTGEVAAEFGIGFAPPGWANLLHAIGDSPQSRAHLSEAGLITHKDQGEPYDRFRDRVMFPIRDGRGRVVGFGGRVLDDGAPKYLNSPETPVFHKGRELYGLYHARKALRSLQRLLVVEGYMDVVALAQHGIRYAVATLGTAATGEHLEKLFRTATEVVFCFDGDAAGRKAARRALETALPLLRDGRQAAFMFLPEGEDPDSLVRTAGREDFERRIGDATSLAGFLFDHLLEQVNLGTLDGRARLVELAKPLLARLPPGAFRDLTFARLSELSGLEQSRLEAQLTGRGGPRRPKGRPLTSKGRERPRRSLVRTAVTLLLHHPQLACAVSNWEGVRTLDLPGVPLLVELLELLSEKPNITVGAILEHFRDREAHGQLARLATEEIPLESPASEREFAHCIAKLISVRDEQRFELLSQKDRAVGLTDAEKREFGTLIGLLQGK